METLELFFAMLFGLAGVLLIVYLAAVLLRPILGEFKGFRQRFMLKSCVKAARQADKELITALNDKGLALIRESFYLSPHMSTPEFVTRVLNHNLSALGRIVSAAEYHKRELKPVSIAEELFQTRAQLMLALIERREAERNIIKKRSGKAPKWARDEVQQQIREVLDRIDVNRRSIEQALDELFGSLLSKSSDDVVYH